MISAKSLAPNLKALLSKTLDPPLFVVKESTLYYKFTLAYNYKLSLQFNINFYITQMYSVYRKFSVYSVCDCGFFCK